MQYRLMQRVQAQAWLKGLHFAVPASTEKRGSHSDRPKAHETFCAQPAEVANEPEPARAHEMNSMLKRHCHGPCAPYVYNRSRRADLVNHAARQLKPRRYQQAYRAFAITALDYDALLFDCDGVLVDTEAQGHRVAFNEAFQQKGLDVEWPLELYGELLHTGGGKERMTRHFTELGDSGPFSSKDQSQQQALVKDLHLLKTDLFMKMIEDGQMPLREGVQRLISEAVEAGVLVAVCSTSNERAVTTIRDVLLGPQISEKMQVYAGDIVPKKKPDPAVYLLAAKELSVDPSRCVVVEDSRIGLQAAKAAGMRCLVTTSSYTKDEDFTEADAVVSELGRSITLSSLTVESLKGLGKVAA